MRGQWDWRGGGQGASGGSETGNKGRKEGRQAGIKSARPSQKRQENERVSFPSAAVECVGRARHRPTLSPTTSPTTSPTLSPWSSPTHRPTWRFRPPPTPPASPTQAPTVSAGVAILISDYHDTCPPRGASPEFPEITHRYLNQPDIGRCVLRHGYDGAANPREGWWRGGVEVCCVGVCVCVCGSVVVACWGGGEGVTISKESTLRAVPKGSMGAANPVVEAAISVDDSAYDDPAEPSWETLPGATSTPQPSGHVK